jgi:hypothetical protein
MQLPNIKAIAVAPRPTLVDVKIAVKTPLLSPSRDHQTVENDCGGQEKVFDGLNEFNATTINGTYIKVSVPNVSKPNRNFARLDKFIRNSPMRLNGELRINNQEWW